MESIFPRKEAGIAKSSANSGSRDYLAEDKSAAICILKSGHVQKLEPLDHLGRESSGLKIKPAAAAAFVEPAKKYQQFLLYKAATARKKSTRAEMAVVLGLKSSTARLKPDTAVGISAYCIPKAIESKREVFLPRYEDLLDQYHLLVDKGRSEAEDLDLRLIEEHLAHYERQEQLERERRGLDSAELKALRELNENIERLLQKRG